MTQESSELADSWASYWSVHMCHQTGKSRWSYKYLFYVSVHFDRLNTDWSDLGS